RRVSVEVRFLSHPPVSSWRKWERAVLRRPRLLVRVQPGTLHGRVPEMVRERAATPPTSVRVRPRPHCHPPWGLRRWPGCPAAPHEGGLPGSTPGPATPAPGRGEGLDGRSGPLTWPPTQAGGAAGYCAVGRSVER